MLGIEAFLIALAIGHRHANNFFAIAVYFFHLVFQANRTGKLTTFALSLLLLAYVLDGERFYQSLTALALIALALSTFSYGKRALMYRGRS